jgi:O-antigen ligase
MPYWTMAKHGKVGLLAWIGFLALQIVMVLIYGWDMRLTLFLTMAAALTLVVISNFRCCLYLLIVSLFIKEYLFTGSGTRVADLVVVILLLSYLTRGALRGELFLLRTPLDKPILIFLGVLALSLINAVDLNLGIKNFSRHLQLFALFYIIQSEIRGREVNKFLQFFLAITLVHALYNLSLFLLHAGEIRAFGFAGVSFSDMLVASLIICCSFYLFEEGSRNRLKYAVVFFILLAALLATQTRGAVISFSLTYAFVSVIALKNTERDPTTGLGARFWRLTALMLVLVMVAFLLFEPLTANLGHRVLTLYQLPTEGAQETIQIRLFMWQTALKAFLAHPVLGIGVGQFAVVHRLFPELRFSPLFQYMVGLGAHNVVLSYLSQGGLLGLCSLLYLMLSILKVGWVTQKHSCSRRDLSISTSLLGILFFVVVSSFYAGAWFYSVSGMEFMLFLALTVVLHRDLMTRRGIEVSRP